MAGKFVDLKEAAQMLGVTPEELVEMRSKNEVFGYRDGSSWKFKMEEIERVLSERGSEIRSDSSILSANDEDFENLISGLSSKIQAEKSAEESESILVSEEELGESATGKSTIIGKGGLKTPPSAESDLTLGSASDILKTGDSGNLLEAPSSKLNLGDASDVHASAINLAGPGGSGTGDMPLVKGGSGTGDMPKADLGSGLDFDDDLRLADDASATSKSGSKSGSLDLDDSGEELVLSGASGVLSDIGSGPNRDVTSGAGDSGINLGPSDSGIDLEGEPLDLGGSAVDAMALPEDEDVIALSDESADPDEATQLKADDQFMLSPSDSLVEDESDSGSQVIALEDSSSFDEGAATMLNQGGLPAEVAEDPFATASVADPMGGDAFGAAMSTGGPIGQMGAGPVMMVPQGPTELPYTIWQVLGLLIGVGILSMCGMMMVDVMLNMWSFSDETAAKGGTGLAESIVEMFGLK